MGYKKEELYDLLVNNIYPTDIRYFEIVNFLKALGFIERKGKGSHVIFKNKQYRIVLSTHGKRKQVKKIYIKKISKVIKENNLTL